MGFVGWVGRVFGSGISKVSDLVHWVRNALESLFHILTGLGHVVGRAWRRFAHAVEWTLSWVEQFAAEITHKVRHLLLVTIPNAVHHVLTKAWGYAKAAADTVMSWARSAYHSALNFAQRIVNDLKAWARDAVHWLTTHLAAAVNTLAKTARRVWSLLDDPAHLAQWAIGAIIAAFLGWAARNVVHLGRWFLANGAALVLDEAPTLEDWIARII